MLVERVLAAAAIQRPLADALNTFLAIYERRLTNHTRAYPGVVLPLEACRGSASLAVLTNKPAYHTIRLLHALALSRYFDAVIGGDSAFPRKPDPAALQHLMTMAGATPATHADGRRFDGRRRNRAPRIERLAWPSTASAAWTSMPPIRPARSSLPPQPTSHRRSPASSDQPVVSRENDSPRPARSGASPESDGRLRGAGGRQMD